MPGQVFPVTQKCWVAFSPMQNFCWDVPAMHARMPGTGPRLPLSSPSPSSLLVHTHVHMCTSKRAHTVRAHVKAKSEGSGRASSNVATERGGDTRPTEMQGEALTHEARWQGRTTRV